MNNVCRLCAISSIALENIFAKRDKPKDEPLLMVLLDYCTGCSFRPFDGMPQNICGACIAAAKAAFQFKLKVEQSQRYFKNLLSGNEQKPDIDELSTEEWCISDSAFSDAHLQPIRTEAVNEDEDEHEVLLLKETYAANGHLIKNGQEITESTPLICQNCKWPLGTEASQVDVSITCSLCSKVFETTRGYKKHLDVHSEIIPFRCYTCSVQFENMKQLKDHLLTHNAHGRPFKCPHCPRSFSMYGPFNNHRQTHSDNRPFKCPHCSKTFKRNAEVTKHIIVHTGEKPYQCALCLTGFPRLQSLQVHADRHSSELCYKCAKCPQIFDQPRLLLMHVKSCTEVAAYKRKTH